jgi:hypothetical protein
MSQRAGTNPQESTIARTLRIARSASRKNCGCGRSLEGQVNALLRRHYGDKVDILRTSWILGLQLPVSLDITVFERLRAYRMRSERASRSKGADARVRGVS